MSTSRFGTSVLPGQLAQQRAEGALDVLQLLLVDVEVHGLRMLGLELAAQLLLLVLALLELGLLLVPDEEVEQHDRQHHEAQRRPRPARTGSGQRPGSRGSSDRSSSSRFIAHPPALATLGLPRLLPRHPAPAVLT